MCVIKANPLNAPPAMLGAIFRARRTAVAPEGSEDSGESTRSELFSDQFVEFIRAKSAKLSKKIDKKLQPTRVQLHVTPRVIDSLDTTWYPTRDLRIAIRAGNAIEFVNRHDQRELGFQVIGTGACCVDFPSAEIRVRKAMFTQRHMPYGLAVVAAIISEATCSPLDLVYTAYLEWERFFAVTFGSNLLLENPETQVINFANFEIAETVVFAFTARLIGDILIPILERYRYLEQNHRVTALCYRHFHLESDVKHTIRRFMRKMERAMLAEINLFAIEPRRRCF